MTGSTWAWPWSASARYGHLSSFRPRHNYSTFRVNYELLRDAEKDVEWKVYDHDEHGFLFITRNPEGVYDPDSIQQEAVRDAIAFLDRHLNGP